MFCSKCGKENRDIASFCKNCGAPLGSAESEPIEQNIEEAEERTTLLQEPVHQKSEPKFEIPNEKYKENIHGKAENECNANSYSGYKEADYGYGMNGNKNEKNYDAYRDNAFVPYWDHTEEFDPKDISDNKVIAMAVYLLGLWGIVIALIASNTSPYARFHVRQALKFMVVQVLTVIVMGLLVWTFIVPIAGCIFLFILFIVKIICFLSICNGKAKEPAIIRSFGFLK